MRRTFSKQYKQGIYRPIHPDKLLGATRAIYRSSFELKFFRFCDLNPNVVKWGSESVVIPYESPMDHRMHRYYVDNVVLIKEGDTLGRYLIEIKPKAYTVPPVESARKKTSTILYEKLTWAQNNAKWEAARKFCQTKGWQFKILTEEDLNIV